MGIGETFVSQIRERKKNNREKQSKSKCERGEREKKREILPRCFDFGGEKKSPNNLAHVGLEKMRAAKKWIQYTLKFISKTKNQRLKHFRTLKQSDLNLGKKKIIVPTISK